MMIEILKENNLIICPSYLKKSIIQEMNQQKNLISFKIMDLSEFMRNYFFTYDKKTISYLMKKYHLKYEIALEYLETLYYVENKNYHSNKLNDLVSLKKELQEKELFISNPFFHYYLEHTSIIIYGYDFLDPFYTDLLSRYSNIKWIKEESSNIQKNVYEFIDIDDEITFICEEIKKKLDQNIPITNIKIIRPTIEYLLPLKRIFSWCHLPIDLEEKIALAHIPLGKRVLEELKRNTPLEVIIQKLEEEHFEVEEIISIFNQYPNTIDHEILIEMIEYDLNHTYLKQQKKENCIQIISLEELREEDYGYLLGFNKENYPKIDKDEDFLNDSMKKELKLFDSNENNNISIQTLKNELCKKENLIITYKQKTAFESYNPCFLIEELKMNVLKDQTFTYQLSNRFNEMILAKEYDKYHKYGIISNSLKRLISTYPDISYGTYDNQFQKLDETEFLNSLKKPLTLSYSAIDQYYRCSFRYYVSNILKIQEENSDDFYRNIGNIFHYVLSQFYQKDFNFEDAWNKEASKYEFTFTKLIFLEKLKKELKYDLEILKKQESFSSFHDYYLEKRFSIPIPNQKNLPIEFVGVVDKISYLKEDNRTLAAVIDYKTGTLPSNLNHIIHGIGMQLPIYLYFLKRSNLFPNLEVVGFYLQKVINKDVKWEKRKTLEELKEDALKLVGYSTDQEDILERFDMTYADSQVIHGLKKKQDGFYANSKVLGKEELENLDHLIENNIQKACDSILDGDFRINPKRIGDDNLGCEYCSYRDICYYTENDVVELEKHTKLDFLGGNDDAKLDERTESSNL